MALQHKPTAPHHSAQDALRVLETVTRRTSGVTDTEIARLSGLDRERLTTLLRMLRREGYVEQTADGTYVTGEALARLGSAHGREQALREKLQRTLDRLRDSVGAAVYISRYVDGEVSVTQYADSPATPKVNEWVDFRVSAHATAVGKSLLTQLDHAGRRDHLARHRMARLTSRTITSDKLLLSRLESQPPPCRSSTSRSTRWARSARPSRSPPVPPWAAWPCRSRSSTRTGCAGPPTS